MKKALLIILTIVILGIGSALVYITFVLPSVNDAPELIVDKNPENIARGAYLANSVAVCMDCHSTRDWSLYSGPIVPNTMGKGGEIFNREMGFPGVYVSRNLTPYGLESWTDGEIFRAVTSGVNKDGKALFDVMPHPNYGRADKQDIYDLIAYLRSLEPIEYTPPASESDFPMSLIINTIPHEPQFTEIPPEDDKVAYGGYLVNMASCADCHTPFDKGSYDMTHRLAGGRHFQLPWATLTSANLTPDPNTGLGKWSEQQFINRFKMYLDSSYVLPKVSEGDMMTLMPWTMYATMKEEDLSAIYSYLQSLEPVSNQVQIFTLNE